MPLEKKVTGTFFCTVLFIIIIMTRITTISVFCLILGVAAISAFEIYVSPSGNDNWSGLLPESNSDGSDGPFQTISKAQATLRQMKANKQLPSETVYVTIREGDYHLGETLRFTEEDAGISSAKPIIYRAFDQEKVRILGSMPLSGWSPATNDLIPDSSKVWQICGDQVSDIYAANGNNAFHSLFVEGTRAVRAKIPNSGYLYWDESFTFPDADVWNFDSRKGFYYRNNDLNPDWHNIEEINIVYFYAWTTEWNYIKSINGENRTVYFNTPAGVVPGSFSYSKRYYVENVLEGLDHPREWYFDTSSMCVYYYPTAWEDMETISVEAPVLQVLLSINGSAHLHFEGLHLENADWQIYASDGVYFASGQAAAITDKLRGSVMVAFADDITFDKITLTDVGVYGIFVENSTNFHLRNSHLYDLGAGAIWMRDGVFDSEVYNNYIHHGGRVFEGSVGILVHKSSNIQIHNNEVADFPYTGISIGWNWGHGPNATTNISISYNSVHLLGKFILSDLGGIYTLGQQPGTVVKNNHIYQVQAYVGSAYGSYSDEGSSYIVVSENIIHDTSTSAMVLHYGALNIARNNVLIPGGNAMSFWNPKSKTDDFDWTIEKNIVLPTGDPVYRIYPTDWSSDSNLFLNVGCEILFDDYGVNFEDYQSSTGKDANSRWVDFAFSNIDALRRGDFSSLPTTDVSQLGITLPDTAAIGLRSNMAPLIEEYPVDRCSAVADFTFDFEEYDEGDTYSGLFVRTVIGLNEGDVIAFSDAQPSPTSGTRSLAFTPAVGWFAPWCLLSGPGFSEGRIIFSFDIFFSTNDTGIWIYRNSRLGPNLVITNQEMQIHGTTVNTAVPTQTWLRFTISHVIGVGNYSYSMQDLTNNGPIKEYWVADAPVCGSNLWKIAPLNDIGNTFYMDNIHIGAVPPSVSVTAAGDNAVTVTYNDDYIPLCGLEVYVDNAFYKQYFSDDMTGKSGQLTVQLDGVLAGEHSVHVIAKTNNAHAKSSAVTVQVVAPPVSDSPSDSPQAFVSSGSVVTVSAVLSVLALLV